MAGRGAEAGPRADWLGFFAALSYSAATRRSLAARRAAPAAVRLEAAPPSQQQLDPPADAALHAQEAPGSLSNGTGPAGADRPRPPPAAAAAAAVTSVAESSRPSIDIGSLLSGSLASTLGSRDGGVGGSWASRDELGSGLGSGSGTLMSSLDASWEYRCAGCPVLAPPFI